jgi:UDP-N-acetyl-D-glucosamine/UDP-N-acetyl-D-galactosamine dehydrogenase
MDPGLAELSGEHSPLASPTVAVIGLGYVGLPLALAFGGTLRTVAYDIDRTKIRCYREGRDPTAQMEPEAFTAADQAVWTEDPGPLREADFVIVAVPTPVDAAKQPDLTQSAVPAKLPDRTSSPERS